MTFRVGQKVVCVDAEPHLFLSEGISNWFLKKGAIYIVTSVCETPVTRRPAIEIDEDLGGIYLRTRFRPIVERKTDISIFMKMLTPKKARV